ELLLPAVIAHVEHEQPEDDRASSVPILSTKALFALAHAGSMPLRRRRQPLSPSMPRQAAISPGRPAPKIGPGTAAVGVGTRKKLSGPSLASARRAKNMS